MSPRFTHSHAPSPSAWIGASLVLFLASACGGTGPEPPPASGAQELCADEDGDGFGHACEAGPDCDDGDPATHERCECREPTAEGCPCEVEGAVEACGEVAIPVGKQTVCGMGYATCDQGVWGACILNPAAELATSG